MTIKLFNLIITIETNLENINMKDHYIYYTKSYYSSHRPCVSPDSIALEILKKKVKLKFPKIKDNIKDKIEAIKYLKDLVRMDIGDGAYYPLKSAKETIESWMGQ